MEIIESSVIQGVKQSRLQAYTDQRGRFLETFRTSWFPERRWEIIQTNRSDSRAGVLRGLHYHFRQVDYWVVTAGRIQVGLVDLRASSPTHLAVQMIELGEEDPTGLFIPMGVAHGFLALTDATLTYLVDNYYDGDDELGVAWDDPQFGLPWSLSHPILSPRDQANPRWQDVPADRRPR